MEVDLALFYWKIVPVTTKFTLRDALSNILLVQELYNLIAKKTSNLEEVIESFENTPCTSTYVLHFSEGAYLVIDQKTNIIHNISIYGDNNDGDNLFLYTEQYKITIPEELMNKLSMRVSDNILVNKDGFII